MPQTLGTIENHVTNPSVEADLTNYFVVASRGAVEQSTEQVFSGEYSAKLTSNFTDNGTGQQLFNYQFVVSWSDTDPTSAGEWVYVPSGNGATDVRFSVDSYDAGGFLGVVGAVSMVTQHGSLLTDQWVRLTLEDLTPLAGTTQLRLRLLDCANAIPGDVFYVDGLMVVKSATLPDYHDGDSDDHSRAAHSWTGPPHASTSIKTLYAAVVARLASGVDTGRRGVGRGWRYLATRLHGDGTEELLDPDLPLEDVTIEDVLSGHNALSGRIEPSYARLLHDRKPVLDEWSTAIYAENDGDIRGGGILLSSGFEGPAWTLEAVGFTGYGQGLPYTGAGYKGIKVDPIDVMRVIWDHIQSQTGGNVGLTFDDTTTGGKVSIGTSLKQVEFDSKSGPISFESGPYKLNWYTNHDLASDIDKLAAETPFDYHERHFWDGDTIRHHVDIGYPNLGRRRNELRFIHGVNVFTPVAAERDGSQYASGTMVLGAGEGASMIKAIQEPASRPGGRLRRIAVVVDDSIRSRSKAAMRAQAENQWRARLGDVETIIVQDHSNAPLGSVKVGDEIRLEGRGDWIDLDIWVRVLSIAFQPENGNIAEYTVARTDKLAS